MSVRKCYKKLPLLLFGTLASFFLLVACGQKTATPKEESSVADTSNKKREIKHAMGTTPIEGKPKRIVTLYQGATDSLLALGIQPVGAVEAWTQKPMYDYLKNDLPNVTYVGQETQPNLEEISKLKPDLIIASKIRHEEIYEQLSQIAPTVAHETVYNFKETVELLGQATGEEKKASDLISKWDTRVGDFNTKIKEKMGDKWPLSAAVLNYRADHARIYITGFAGSILNELGFKGPKDIKGENLEIVKLTDKESIPQMNADVFYQFMDNNDAVKKNHEEWTSHPLYKNLDAAKAGQEYIVDEIIWNLGGGIQAANLMLDDLYKRFELEK